MTDEPATPPASYPAGGLRLPGWVRLAILAALAVLAGWYLLTHREDFAILAEVDAGPLLLAAAVNGLVYVSGALVVRAVVRPFHIRIGWIEAIHLALLTRFGNVFLPFRGGMGLRAAYLSRAHGLPLSRFVAGLAGTMMASMFVSSLVALGGLAWAWGRSGGVSWWAAGGLTGFCVSVVALAVWRPQIRSRGPAVWRAVAAVLDGWHELCEHRRTLAAVVGAAALQVCALAGVYALLLADMGVDASWPAVVTVIAAGNVSTLIMITPGSIGVYEAAIAALAGAVGVSPPAILAAAVVWRALDTGFILLSGGAAGIALTRGLRRPGGGRKSDETGPLAPLDHSEKHV